MKLLKSFINYLLITFSLLFLGLEGRAFSLGYYLHQFKVNQIAKITSRNETELKAIAKALIAYLQQGKNNLLTPYFNEREVLHMEDVYHLFKTMYILQLIFLILILYLSYQAIKKRNFRNLWRQTGYFLGGNYLLVAFGYFLFQKVDFSTFFIKFHEVFFSNDLWLMDPETDLMIQMLPETFFQTIALETILLWLILIAILQIIIFVISKIIIRYLRQRVEAAKIYGLAFLSKLKSKLH